jgi:hypothetical protein
MTADDVVLRDALAEVLHDVMCPTSHHDRPPARCSGWARYPMIAESVASRLQAALSRWPGDSVDKDAALRRAAESTQPEVYLAAIERLYVIRGATLATHEANGGELARLRRSTSYLHRKADLLARDDIRDEQYVRLADVHAIIDEGEA